MIPDGTDIDRNADLTTQGGKVTIMCNATNVRLIPYGEPGRMLSLPSAPFTIDPSTGELFDTHGAMGLYVLDPMSGDIDPRGFTYTATVVPNVGSSWSVTFGGNSVLPDVVDLVRLASIAPATGKSTLEQRVATLEALAANTSLDIDHGELAGLDDDDHPQYAFADGSRGAFAAPLGADDNYVTDSEKVKLSNLSGTNTGDQDLSGYSTTDHGHTSTDIHDFVEAVQDAVAALLTSGSNVTLSYDDAGDKLTVSAAGGDAEAMRDTIGAALVGINGVTVTINDALDTITLAVTGLTIAQITGLQGALDSRLTEAESDARYVRTVNGTVPDASGNVEVASGITVTLTVAGWSANSQTVVASGVTASSLLVVSPIPAHQVAYVAAGIICTTQGTDTLTFTCSTTPTAALDVQVVIL